jgi:hypothetical protein
VPRVIAMMITRATGAERAAYDGLPWVLWVSQREPEGVGLLHIRGLRDQQRGWSYFWQARGTREAVVDKRDHGQ